MEQHCTAADSYRWWCQRRQRRRWKGRGGAVRRSHVSQKWFAMRVRAGLASLLTNAIPGCTDPCSSRRRRLSFVHSKSRPFPAEFNCRCRCAQLREQRRVHCPPTPVAERSAVQISQPLSHYTT